MLIPAGESRAECRVRGSRFLAWAGRAPDMATAARARESERKKYHDATHHVLAARVSVSEVRADDDGEPAGTAGRPALGVLEQADLVQAFLVITRYFGGTKLGTGGLARAYTEAARRAVTSLALTRVIAARILHLTFAYSATGGVTRVLEAAGAVRRSQEYDTQVHLEVAVPEPGSTALKRELVDATAGEIRIRECEQAVLIPMRT